MSICPSNWCRSDQDESGDGRHAYHYRGNEVVKLDDGPADPDEGKGAERVSVTLERVDRWIQQGTMIVGDHLAVIRIDLDRHSGTTSRNFWGYATAEQAEELIAALTAHVVMLRGADDVAVAA
jgi:hypothetical protein